MYGSGRETWREWGRTLALNEVTTPARQIQDVALLALTQAAPLPLLALLGFAWRDAGFIDAALLTVNGLLLSIRIAVLCAAAHCYRPARGFYWLSPLADSLAVVRIALSALWPRREWRGRHYASGRKTA
jgi:dolichol-phosphate mannosyltransferase